MLNISACVYLFYMYVFILILIIHIYLIHVFINIIINSTTLSAIIICEYLFIHHIDLLKYNSFYYYNYL